MSGQCTQSLCSVLAVEFCEAHIAKGWHLALLGHLGMHLSGISSWRSQSTQTRLPCFAEKKRGKRSLLVYPKNDVKFLLKHHTKGGFR